MVDVEMRAMVFLLQFLEEADPDTVDPDAALDALETVADWVNQLPTDDRQAFAVRLQQYATKEPELWLAKSARDLPNMLDMT